MDMEKVKADPGGSPAYDGRAPGEVFENGVREMPSPAADINTSFADTALPGGEMPREGSFEEDGMLPGEGMWEEGRPGRIPAFRKKEETWDSEMFPREDYKDTAWIEDELDEFELFEDDDEEDALTSSAGDVVEAGEFEDMSWGSSRLLTSASSSEPGGILPPEETGKRSPSEGTGALPAEAAEDGGGLAVSGRDQHPGAPDEAAAAEIEMPSGEGRETAGGAQEAFQSREPKEREKGNRPMILSKRVPGESEGRAEDLGSSEAVKTVPKAEKAEAEDLGSSEAVKTLPKAEKAEADSAGLTTAKVETAKTETEATAPRADKKETKEAAPETLEAEPGEDRSAETEAAEDGPAETEAAEDGAAETEAAEDGAAEAEAAEVKTAAAEAETAGDGTAKEAKPRADKAETEEAKTGKAGLGEKVKAILTGGKAAAAQAVRETAGFGKRLAPKTPEASDEPAKPKRRPQVIAGAAAIALAGLGLVYGLCAQRYDSHFIGRTTINGIDVGGMNLDEAEETIRQSVEDYTLTVELMGGHTHTIKAPDFDYTYLPGAQISSLMKAQNKYHWIKGLFKETAYDIETPASYNVDKLMSIVGSFEEVNREETISPRDAYMYYTRGGRFAIIPEVVGNEIDAAALTQAVLDTAVRNESTLMAVDQEGIYRKPAVTSEDATLKERVDHLNRLFGVSISYTLPDDEVMTYGVSDLSELTGLDESGCIYKDITDEALEESIRSFVARMARTDLVSDRLPFRTTDVGTVYFSMGTTWGHVINQDAIVREMKACFASGHGGSRDLIYSFNRKCPDAIGGTYLEIDIPTQSVYYYVDYEPIFYCGCVSGREYDRATPSGIYDIKSKSRNIYLEGDFDAEGKPGYRSFVNFWMKFYGGYGLHDASWRSGSEFGTSTYLYDGSHGCVNLSYSSAQFLYENVPIGTTVLVVR